MKCIRCGQEIEDYVCPNCDFDNKTVIKMKVNESTAIDSPIITFFLGIVSVILSVIIFLYPNIIFFLILYFLVFAFTFYFSTRNCRETLKPVREIGLWLGYISFAIVIIALVLSFFS